MIKSQTRVRSGFVIGLAAFLIFLGGLGYHESRIADRQRVKARFIQSRFEVRLIAQLVDEQAIKAGGITNIEKEFVLRCLQATNGNPFSFGSRTNESGQIVDLWQTPFRIEIVEQTNVAVSSAGPNLKFGDEDDINFNSSLTAFVKP